MTSQGIHRLIIIIFIDDLNIFYLASNEIMKQVKEELFTAFDMVDIRPLVFYIELKVTRNCEQKTIKLLQPGYIKKLFN